MTNTLQVPLPQDSTQLSATAATDSAQQHREQELGRMLVNNLFVLLKTAYIHQQNNTALHRPLASIQETMSALLQHTEDDRITLRPVSSAFFLNQTLIRFDRSSFQNAAFLRIICSEVRIGMFEFYRGCDEKAFRALMQSIVDVIRGNPSEGTPLQRDFETIYLKPPVGLSGRRNLQHQRQFLLHSYALALTFTSHLLARWPRFGPPPLSRIKRTIQSLLEMIDLDRVTLLGLTQLRAYRQHPATHLVNVAILTLMIAQKAGFSRPELVQVGMTALLHELGILELPKDLLTRTEPLGEREKEELHQLPLHSVQRVLQFPLVGLESIARTVTIFENRAHLPTPPSYHNRLAADLNAQLIAVADAYDHLTTARMGKGAVHADQALDVLLQNPEGKFADWAVNLLATAIGRYPVGTLVELDTGERGLVIDVPAEGAPMSRPRVRLISSVEGLPTPDDKILDLRDTDEAGHPLRSIRRSLSPDVVPLNIPHFFLD